MFKKIAVIGLGNALRRDDGVGIAILRTIVNSYKQPNLDYFDFGIASFDLIHRLQEYDLVFLIDGINASLVPGELRIFELKDVEYNSKIPPISTHELGLRSLFELYKKFKLKTKIYVMGIQVKDVSFGQILSDEIKQKLGQNVKEISSFINKKIK